MRKMFSAGSLCFSFLVLHSPVCADTAPGLIGARINPNGPTAEDREWFAYDNACKKDISSNFQESLAPEGFTVFFHIDKSGKILDVESFDSSKAAFFDIAALEAVMTSGPLERPPSATYQGSSILMRSDFRPRIVSGKHDKSKPVMVHAIPIGVSARYPGTFTRTELTEKSNQIAVQERLPTFPYATMQGTSHGHSAQSVVGKTLFEFFNDWQNYFCQHKAASKEELLKHRDYLLQKFRGKLR